jgi:hypothetical protein
MCTSNCRLQIIPNTQINHEAHADIAAELPNPASYAHMTLTYVSYVDRMLWYLLQVVWEWLPSWVSLLLQTRVIN